MQLSPQKQISFLQTPILQIRTTCKIKQICNNSYLKKNLKLNLVVLKVVEHVAGCLQSMPFKILVETNVISV